MKLEKAFDRLVSNFNGINGRDWLKGKHLEVYVRVGVRLVMGEALKTIDIANVTTPKDRIAGGVEYWKFVESCVNRADFCCVYIENVLSADLAAVYRKNNWKEVYVNAQARPPAYVVPCFYKLIQQPIQQKEPSHV